MRRRKEQSIGDIIQQFFRENPEIQEKIEESRIQRVWAEVLGPSITQYTQSLFIKNHILFVKLTSSVLRNELLLHRERLIVNLNQHAGTDLLKNIIFR